MIKNSKGFIFTWTNPTTWRSYLLSSLALSDNKLLLLSWRPSRNPSNLNLWEVCIEASVLQLQISVELDPAWIVWHYSRRHLPQWLIMNNLLVIWMRRLLLCLIAAYWRYSSSSSSIHVVKNVILREQWRSWVMRVHILVAESVTCVCRVCYDWWQVA